MKLGFVSAILPDLSLDEVLGFAGSAGTAASGCPGAGRTSLASRTGRSTVWRCASAWRTKTTATSAISDATINVRMLMRPSRVRSPLRSRRGTW